MSNPELAEVIEHLNLLIEERDLSKKFKEKAGEIVSLLQSDVPMAIEKALMQLEELNSFEIPSYHRTQVWDIISKLESINC